MPALHITRIQYFLPSTTPFSLLLKSCVLSILTCSLLCSRVFSSHLISYFPSHPLRPLSSSHLLLPYIFLRSRSRTVPFSSIHFISFHSIPSLTISYHSISFHLIPFYFISFQYSTSQFSSVQFCPILLRFFHSLPFTVTCVLLSCLKKSKALFARQDAFVL